MNKFNLFKGIIVLLMVLFYYGCEEENNENVEPIFTDTTTYDEEGMASWYGPGFQGNITASGDTFDMYKLTAAHKSLDFNTMVEVTNKENLQKITVRINDRGPYIEGRIIDLSKAAADSIDMIEAGVVEVGLCILE